MIYSEITESTRFARCYPKSNTYQGVLLSTDKALSSRADGSKCVQSRKIPKLNPALDMHSLYQFAVNREEKQLL